MTRGKIAETGNWKTFAADEGKLWANLLIREFSSFSGRKQGNFYAAGECKAI